LDKRIGSNVGVKTKNGHFVVELTAEQSQNSTKQGKTDICMLCSLVSKALD